LVYRNKTYAIRNKKNTMPTDVNRLIDENAKLKHIVENLRKENTDLIEKLSKSSIPINNNCITKLDFMNETCSTLDELAPEESCSYKGRTVLCRWAVSEVYDGDSAKIIFVDRKPTGDILVKIPFRFSGIDTEELKQPIKLEESVRVSRKATAIKQRDGLRKMLISPQYITVAVIEGREKFKRLLGEVYFIEKSSLPISEFDVESKAFADSYLIPENSVSQNMINQYGAIPYFGGKRNTK
jgi:endonuclease YncB( thermonuclease family)